jgi:hypothetical protein
MSSLHMNFFSVGQFTHTSTLFFLNVTKIQESVTKNSGQGEIIIQDLDVTTRIGGLIRFWLGNPSTF